GMEGLPTARLGRRADGRGDRPSALDPPVGGGTAPGVARRHRVHRVRPLPDRPAVGRPTVSAVVPIVAPDATADIATACAETGFFVVVDHGIDLAPIFDAARRFFALPLEAKERVAMVDDNGYAGIGSRRAGDKEMM